MFCHAAATCKHENHHAISGAGGNPQQKKVWKGELTTMELDRPDSSWEDIVDCNVYQLRKLLGRMLCDKEMEACIFQETVDSIKEFLWCKWLSTLLGEELRQSPACIPRLDPQANFQARNCTTYDRFMAVRWDSCEEALVVARDAHRWALVAAALLEDKIDRIGHSLSCSHWHSRSCRCLGSHQWRRSWTADCWTKFSKVTSCHGDPTRR